MDLDHLSCGWSMEGFDDLLPPDVRSLIAEDDHNEIMLRAERSLRLGLEAQQDKRGQIKAVFADVGGHVKFDAKLAKAINDFQIAFVNKNEDHMAFFGGNLTGVEVVRFNSHDKDRFFIDVVGVDETDLEQKLHAVPAIKPDRHVSSDPFNHLCIWMIHGFYHAKGLKPEVQQRAMVDLGLILCYRFITSLLFRYFKYPADKQVAAAAYSQLTYKFAIKQHGTWSATLEARSVDMVSPTGIHKNTIAQYDDDEDIVYMVNDTQGRVRDMVKNIVRVHYLARAQGDRVKTTSMVMEYDGKAILKDKTKSLDVYTRYMHSIISDQFSFIKQDVVDVVSKVVHTSPPAQLMHVLVWCSSNYRHTGIKDVEELVDATLIHSFAYLSNNSTVFRETNDLAFLIAKLKGVYTSSRSNDQQLMHIRELAEKIVKKASTTKNQNVVASVRTALLLYIVVRAFTMSHFSGAR